MSTPYAPDPFDTTQLLTLPPQPEGLQAAWQGFQFDDKLDSDTFQLPDVRGESLPTLEAGLFELSLNDAPVPSLDASSVSDYATADEDGQEQAFAHATPNFDASEDVWVLPAVRDVDKKTVLTSWDHLLEEDHIEPGSAYLSETAARVFDTIVQTSSNSNIQWLRPDIFLNALYELALGRSSIYFHWDAETSRFLHKVESLTVTGFTPATMARVVERFKSSGTIFNTLQRHHQQRSRWTNVIAFGAALRSCLAAVESYMDSRRPEIASILILQQICEGPQTLLGVLDRLSHAMQDAPTDANMLSLLLRQCLSSSLQHPEFTEALNGILVIAFGPVMNQLAASLGLLSTIQNTDFPPYHLLESRELVQVAKETHEALVLLQKTAPEGLRDVQSPLYGNVVRLAFSWSDVNEIQEAAALYEVVVKKRILQLACEDNSQRTDMFQPASPQKQVLPDTNTGESQQGENAGPFGLDLSQSELVPADELQKVAMTCLRSSFHLTDTLAVPLDDVVELSLSPLIHAQHRLLSYFILDNLFSANALQRHLRLLQHIHLFGDGIFAARLSLALFDEDVASGEGRRRTGATTGLRLQARDSWPPASSELRLVLMGVLSHTLSTTGMSEFEDSISFAIRDLSDDELELCRDMDSVHALDFLKLHYKSTNSVLGAFLSSETLERYDRIFKHILRVLRLKSVAQGLLRSACRREGTKTRRQDHKFLVEIQHFISVLADYCHNIAIAGPWARMQVVVDAVGRKLDAQDYDGTLHYGKSLEHLTQLHGNTLEEILRVLFLKQTEAKTMAALEEVFGLILRYAASLRRNVNDDDDNDDDMMTTIRRFQDDFRTQVKRFVDRVKMASDRGSPKVGLGGQESDPMEELLLMLDFNGHWTKG